MQQIRGIWLTLLAATTAASLGYAYFSMTAGNVDPELFTYFTPQQLEEGRAYSRPLRLSFILAFLAQCAFLGWAIISGRAEGTARKISGLFRHSAISSLAIFSWLLLVLQLIQLPFSFFSGFLWQKHWGFSTQTVTAWLIDYSKSLSLEFVLAGLGALLLSAAMRRQPRWWWLSSAVFLSAWLIVASYLWPVVISPLFNRFAPLDNPAVTSMVKNLANKANVPVNEVLIMDASRRTTKANAYFAGLGNTRRIVLYDTLLRDYPPDEVEAVVAHELTHWSQGHIQKGIIWGVLGLFLAWGGLFIALRLTFPRTGYPPHVWAYILLFFLTTSFLTAPIQNAISRRMEREADTVAVMLTENAQAAIRLQIRLAVKNHSDLAPSEYISWFNSHPSALERIKAFKSGIR